MEREREREREREKERESLGAHGITAGFIKPAQCPVDFEEGEDKPKKINRE